MNPKEIDAMKSEIRTKISAAAGLSELDALRIHYLGRKGVLTELLKHIKSVPKKERASYGKEVNELKKFFEGLYGAASAAHPTARDRGRLDVTEPGVKHMIGSTHVISSTNAEILQIFMRLGFKVATGPEIETDWYNFEALNIPPDHPARDTQDTFYVESPSRDRDRRLLRTHTSPVQIKVMQSEKPPIRVVVPGRVYRRDLDPTHTPMFHQIEGLLVDDSTNFAELKGTLTFFAHEFFGKDVKLRFRPHHFPFTEPSAEIDVSCTICGGKGLVGGEQCRVCKGTKWLEILGAGMVHPNVLKHGGISPNKYRGFAFGVGIDRLAMLKFGIPDLRILFENDIRFLEQF